MPHYAPGVNVYEDGVFVTRSQDIDARTNITATQSGKFAELDATGGGGGGSGFQVDDEGSPVQTGVIELDTVDGVFVDSFGTGFAALGVYGCRSGVLASRPAAGRKNKMGVYYATDTKTIYFSTGAAWITEFVLGTMSGQDASAVTITGGSVTGITDLAIADGGTGASTAAAARTNLAAMMALARTSVKTTNYAAAAGELVPVDTTGGAVTITLPNAPADQSLVSVKNILQGGTNAVTVNCAGSDTFNRTSGAVTSSLALLAQGAVYQYTAAAAVWTLVATDVPLSQLDLRFQPLKANLTAIGNLTTAADKVTYWTGAGTAALADLTAAARALLDDLTAAAMRTTLGLGDMAIQNRPALNIGRLNVTGHSWIAGSTVGNTGTPYMEMQGMLARVAGMFGIHNENIMNLGQSGSALASPNNTTGQPYGGWAGALQYLVPSNATFINDASSPLITHGPCVPGAGLLVHGINDVRANTSSAATQGRNAWKHGLRTWLAMSRVGAVYAHKYLNSVFTWDTQLTFSGWANLAQTTANLGGGVKTSATNGDYVEFLIPSDFRGGVPIDFLFIGGKGTWAQLNGAMTNVTTNLQVLGTTETTNGLAVGDVVTVGTEDMLITSVTVAGQSYAVTRGVNGTVAAAHANLDPCFSSVSTAKVTWSTNGVGATSSVVSGAAATQLSGQGYVGNRVSVVKRFVGLGADMAGKTIRATVAGLVASETYPVQFNAVLIESEYATPQVVLNIPRFAFGIGYTTVNTVASNWNADIATVKAEFDANVQIADLDALIFNKNGTLKTTIAAANTMVVTANTLASWDIAVGTTISINGTRRTVTAMTGPAGSDYTITFDGAAVSATAGVPVSNANWFHTDLIHFNGVGHGVVAGLIYDTFAAMSGTTSAQLGNTSATWVQDQRSGRLGIVNGAYLQPPGAGGGTKASVLNSVYYTPIDIPEECWVTGFSISTSAANANAAARIGLYDNDATSGRPGGIIAELGTTNCVTSAVFNVPDVCYVRVRPGRYWVAMKSETVATTFRGIASGSAGQTMFVATPVSGATSLTGYSETSGGAGALPSTATPTEVTTATPQVLLQVRAVEYS